MNILWELLKYIASQTNGQKQLPETNGMRIYLMTETDAVRKRNEHSVREMNVNIGRDKLK